MTSEPFQVLIPLVNPNERESLVSELRVINGQKVHKGDVLAVFETTKAEVELTAEKDGIVKGLRVQQGDTLPAGDIFCWLVDSLNVDVPAHDMQKPSRDCETSIPQDLRLTKKASEIISRENIPLDDLPRGILITEQVIRDLSATETTAINDRLVIIYGGGGHAKSLIDLIRAEGKYEIAGILDDHLPAGHRIMDISILGGAEQLGPLRRKGVAQAVNAVGGIGSITLRLGVYEKLKNAGYRCVSVIHPRAFVEPTAVLADGCQVFFNAYIGSDVAVGFGSIINTGAIISHDCRLYDYVNISPGAILAGAVTIQKRVLVGMGATINLGVNIGEDARIGNSAVVKADVAEKGIVRAGGIWPSHE